MVSMPQMLQKMLLAFEQLLVPVPCLVDSKMILRLLLLADGQSNWMMGLQLVGTYVLIALLFGFVHGNVDQGYGSSASRTPAVANSTTTPTERRLLF